ncbi:hypothetical protein L1987_82151 [Smallanthus sonchifolius]|uniref:Uncharacterized protein n=2 Tax=Smallanthus sonchifolius TaxID=185202 RepID=A0ACB8YTJ5_9ASTR|nr:hypothetical protein L1987_82149 [Smallanthus sonchifolius]KAI3688438.1 hypothetical protein L1987_82151 [Smallanthus sonchifolius]
MRGTRTEDPVISRMPPGGSGVEPATMVFTDTMDFDQNVTVDLTSTQPIDGTGGLPSAQHPVDTDMNLEFMVPKENFAPNQDVQSVWNSPSSGMESFADKMKKANEIEGLALEYFPPSISDDGCCRIHITQEDLLISAQCSSVPKPMEEVIRDPLLNAVHGPDSVPTSAEGSAPKSASNPRALESDSDGFITVTRRKKSGPIKLQKKKQPPVRLKSSSKQFAPVCSKGGQSPAVVSGTHKSITPDTTRDANRAGVNKSPTVDLNATKKTSKGFNFTRAIQGDLGRKSQQPVPSVLSPKNAVPPNPIDLVSSNRFSVLDIPNSIKLNKLIEVQDDLYPPDQGREDDMDLEINKSKCDDNVVCQLNREHIEGSRILPESILSPPKQSGNSSRGKSYGIPDEQKKDIADRLKKSGCIKVDIVDQWCPGQWDYFNDLCTLMGLDPDYCIEDVDSDTENGTSLFLSGLLNSGAPTPHCK